jgi:hypothetical protein
MRIGVVIRNANVRSADAKSGKKTNLAPACRRRNGEIHPRSGEHARRTKANCHQ